MAELENGDPTFAPATATAAMAAEDDEDAPAWYNQGRGGGKWASLEVGLGFINEVNG